MLLSIIIVTYHHKELILNLLESIELYNDIDDQLEVVIVDNSENDEILNYLKNIKFSLQMKYISNMNNGYGSGNNIGAKCAASKYLLFLNPDTVIVEPVFKYALKQFEKYDMFGMKLLTIDKKSNFSCRYNNSYTIKSALLNRIAKKINIFNPKKYYIVGADIFIKKDLFFRVGMFDENIFMYNEEFDLTQRVLKITKKIGYINKKCIIHMEGSGEYNKFDLNQRSRYLESYRYVCKKYNINYKKNIKNQLRFLKLRKIFSKNKENAIALINLYLNDSKGE